MSVTCFVNKIMIFSLKYKVDLCMCLYTTCGLINFKEYQVGKMQFTPDFPIIRNYSRHGCVTYVSTKKVSTEKVELLIPLNAVF